MDFILTILDTIGLSVVLTFFLVLFAIYYSYSSCDFDCWKNQGIPGDTPWPIVGTSKPCLSFPSIESQDQEKHEKYGRIFGAFEGQKPVLHIIEPELIKQVMVKDFPTFTNRREMEVMSKDPLFGNTVAMMRGEAWKATRSILTPTFTSGKIKQMVYLIEECISTLVKSFEKSADGKVPVDMKDTFSCFTIDVIASCAFGIKTNCIENPNSEFMVRARKPLSIPAFVNYLMSRFKFCCYMTLKLIYVISTLVTFPKISIFASLMSNPFQHFAEIADKMIESRIKSGSVSNCKMNRKNRFICKLAMITDLFISKQNRKDFLDLMLEAGKEEDIENAKENETDNSSVKKKKILTRQAMISNSVIFLLAGFDTTATALSFFAYCLATNPDVQDKLIQEIDDAMIECKGNLTYAVIMGLPYLEKALSEALRLYAPAVRVERECASDDYKLGDIVLKKGTVVMVSNFSLHRDKDFYPNPEVYDPERFSPEAKAARHPFCFMPFGVGPRSCLAMRFAIVEVKFAMALLLSRLRFTTCDKTENPIKFKPGPNILAPVSITLMIEKRKDQPHIEPL